MTRFFLRLIYYQYIQYIYSIIYTLIYNTETQSSSIFGILVSLAGIISTPLGGFLIDYLTIIRSQNYRGHNYDRKLNNNVKLSKNILEIITLQTSLYIIIISNTFGCLLLCILYIIYNKILYLIIIFFGIFCIFLSAASMNIVIMLSVYEQYRAFAVGISMLGLHMFGDVPRLVCNMYVYMYVCMYKCMNV